MVALTTSSVLTSAFEKISIGHVERFFRSSCIITAVAIVLLYFITQVNLYSLLPRQSQPHIYHQNTGPLSTHTARAEFLQDGIQTLYWSPALETEGKHFLIVTLAKE